MGDIVTPERLVADVAPFVPDGPVVVALSGGPDSAVAAYVCVNARPRRDVRAVFVDHQWPHSAEMRRASERVAHELHVSLDVVVVPATATETEARPVRLGALEEAAGGTQIVTGHHADDVAETVLLNLVRGAGSAGLSSIPMNRPPFVRPLLGVSRAAIRHVAETLALPFADDPSNREMSSRRNVMRHDVIPRLEEIAPAAGAALARSAQLLAADDAALEAAAGRVPLLREAAAVCIPAAALTMLQEPLAARIVRRALRVLRGPYAGEMNDVTTTMAAAAAGAPGGQLSGGLRCQREGALVVIDDPSVPYDPISETPLAVPGRFVGATHAVASRIADAGRPRRRPHAASVSADLAGDLVVRSAYEGERIDIGTGSKLVRDAMAERGVPPRLRVGWPVVARHGKIVWIVGVRTAAPAVPRPGASRVLELTTERLGRWTV